MRWGEYIRRTKAGAHESNNHVDLHDYGHTSGSGLAIAANSSAAVMTVSGCRIWGNQCPIVCDGAGMVDLHGGVFDHYAPDDYVCIRNPGQPCDVRTASEEMEPPPPEIVVPVADIRPAGHHLHYLPGDPGDEDGLVFPDADKTRTVTGRMWKRPGTDFLPTGISIQRDGGNHILWATDLGWNNRFAVERYRCDVSPDGIEVVEHKRYEHAENNEWPDWPTGMAVLGSPDDPDIWVMDSINENVLKRYGFSDVRGRSEVVLLGKYPDQEYSIPRMAGHGLFSQAFCTGLTWSGEGQVFYALGFVKRHEQDALYERYIYRLRVREEGPGKELLDVTAIPFDPLMGQTALLSFAVLDLAYDPLTREVWIPATTPDCHVIRRYSLMDERLIETGGIFAAAERTASLTLEPPGPQKHRHLWTGQHWGLFREPRDRVLRLRIEEALPPDQLPRPYWEREELVAFYPGWLSRRRCRGPQTRVRAKGSTKTCG